MAPRVIEYHHVTHNITRPNIAAARRFYGGILGLQEIPTMGDPGGQRLIWFALGSKQLHLIIRDGPEHASNRHIAAYVDDFDSLVAHLQSNGVRLEEPQPGQFWSRRADNSRFAFCYDPDGNRIELMEKAGS